MKLILIALVSIVGFFTGLGSTYAMRRRLGRKKITWQEYRKYIGRCKPMVPIGVILSLVGYYGMEIQPRLLIPFTDLEVRPAIVMSLVMMSFIAGLIMSSMGLAVLIYSLKKPSADRE